MITLRDYQQEAVDALYTWFDEKKDHNPLVVMPTGSGKSLVCAEFCRSALEVDKTTRIVVATHVQELVEQNYGKLREHWLTAPAGIYSAGLGRREPRAQILFCSVQSVAKRALELGHRDLLLVDEAHLIPASGFGRYRQLIDGLRSVNSRMRIIGLTATPFRTDSGSLDKGDDRIFHGVAYSADILRLIAAGWLSDVTNQGTDAEIDTSKLHVRAGEFVEAEMQAAAMADGLVARAVTELVARGKDRRSWLLFCSGIEHAESTLAELRRLGIQAECLFGTTGRSHRRQIIDQFRTGQLRAVVNVDVLTTGFDAPCTDLIAMLRPTYSPGLYVQMVGRGMRVFPGKKDCLVLDFAGNVMRHGPIDSVKVREPGKKGEVEAPMKRCGNCGRLVPTMTRVCPGCGAEFEIAEKDVEHDTVPDTVSRLIGKPKPIERWKVSSVVYNEHVKSIDKPPSMRVTYFCGYQRRVHEFICFEHQGFARKKAERWWLRRGGQEPVPETVDLARVRIELRELRDVLEVIVDTTGEYPSVKDVKLDNADAGGADASDPSAAKAEGPEAAVPF